MKTNHDLQTLAAKLATFKDFTCSCHQCRDLCETVPCLATPQEIKALIEAGHIADLTRTTHCAAVNFGLPPLDCVMILAKDEGGCSLYKDGKCTLHAKGLKPSEGRFANHDPDSQSFPVIAATWMLEENRALVDWIFSQFPNSQPPDAEDLEFFNNIANSAAELIKEGVSHKAISAEINRAVQGYRTARAFFDKLERAFAGGALEIVERQ